MTPFPDFAMYIDIHTHKPTTENDTLSVLNINVPDYIHCCGFDLKKSFSLGIHPWKINEQLLPDNLRFIEENSIYDSIKAIGECGLDKLTATDWELQVKAFQNQILISERTKKPLIIHCVKAFDELLAIKKELNPLQAWIIHGFRGKPQQMEQLIGHGLYLSFGAKYNEETVRQTPPNRFFLETDDSGISVKEIYKQIAETIEISEEELTLLIKDNANTVFGDL